MLTLARHGRRLFFGGLSDGRRSQRGKLDADLPQRYWLLTTHAWLARAVLTAALVLSLGAPPAFAQNYSFDARRIALGGAGGTPNVASKLVERQRRYKSILIPVGLVRLLADLHVFYPNREDFDFSRAVEYVNSPLHFVFGRDEDISAGSLFRDIVKASLQPDLNEYGGFELPIWTLSEGLVSMTWGKTFMLRQDARGFQSIYVGAGPYLVSQARFEFDGELEKILGGGGNIYIPSATMGMGGGATEQLALDITGAYRARFPLFVPADAEAAKTSRNGLYVVANYHHLQGIHYDKLDANLRLDTDMNGFLIPDPPERPFSLRWDATGKGWGLAMDFGTTLVVNRWDIGVGVSGVANKMWWRDITVRDLSLVSLFNQSEFVTTKVPNTSLTAEVSLPVTYTADLAYHRDAWSMFSEYSTGLGGDNFRLGLEYRLNPVIELRGAGRYSNGSWYPSLGLGYNFTRTFGIDAAFYGTQTFLEAEPHVGLAISLRIDRR